MRQRKYLALGIALGLVGFLLVQMTLAGSQRTTGVVVAQTYLPAGHVIEENDIALKQVHYSVAPRGALHSKAQAVGKKLAVERTPGDIIAQEHLGEAKPFNLEPGWRAVAVEVDQRRGLAGKIAPGDRVTLVGVFTEEGGMEEGTRQPLAKILMSGVEVLFVSHSFLYRPPQAQAGAGTGGLLPALPQRQAEKGVVILKVPADPIPITYIDWEIRAGSVYTREVGTVYVEPVELITYLDATNSLYLVLEPQGDERAATPGLRSEHLLLPLPHMRKEEK